MQNSNFINFLQCLIKFGDSNKYNLVDDEKGTFINLWNHMQILNDNMVIWVGKFSSGGLKYWKDFC